MPPLPRGMLEGRVHPQAGQQAEQLETLFSLQAAMALPAVLPASAIWGLMAGSARGCWGTSFLNHWVSPSCPPSARSRFHCYFRKVQITAWLAAVPAQEQTWASGLVAAGPRGQSSSG